MKKASLKRLFRSVTFQKPQIVEIQGGPLLGDVGKLIGFKRGGVYVKNSHNKRTLRPCVFAEVSFRGKYSNITSYVDPRHLRFVEN